MLWNIVYEFFVKYIFGGSFNGLEYQALLGDVWNITDIEDIYYEESYTSSLISFNFDNPWGNNFAMSLGNYLSLVATLITMVAIVLICCALIKKIYNMCAHIIG